LRWEAFKKGQKKEPEQTRLLLGYSWNYEAWNQRLHNLSGSHVALRAFDFAASTLMRFTAFAESPLGAHAEVLG